MDYCFSVIGSRRSDNSMFGDVCCVYAGLNKTNVWVRKKIGVPEPKVGQNGHRKTRSEGLVMAMPEGEMKGNYLPGRRRTSWIDVVRRWTEGGLPAVRRVALD